MKRAIGAASLLAFLAGAAGAQETTLRGVTSFAEGTTFSRPFERFIERVDEQCEAITIDYVGGPSAMPPFEVGNAVQAGVVDIANVTSAYYSNLLPEGEALKLSELTIQEQRANGAWEYINDLHNKKMKAWYLARTGDGVPFHLYLTEAIATPDLGGLTLRTTPVYRAFFTALGANLVQTPPGEVYTALERGVVQGYGWPIQGVLDLGWQEVTNYRVDPGFYNVDVNILVNLDRWNGLTDAQRDCLTEQAIWVEGTNAENAGLNEEERQRQAEAGIETIEFTGEDRATWLETAQSAGWAYVGEVVDQETAARLEELLTK
jgi:TRAP-type C4-dicarboxylate transport system substrate-binding protein